jgi:predicted nuclease of predicted toxin-antitoxin system
VLFLVDANLPRLVVTLLRSLGHHVEFARDIGLAAAPDRDIAARARLTGAVLLTRDLDFANTRQYPPENYPGQVVLRLPEDATARAIAEVVERFVREPNFLAALSSRLAIVEANRVRFRPPLK